MAKVDTRNIPKIAPYNPLDKRCLGENVAEKLVSGPVHNLPPEPFIGAGVYAIYYLGDYELYRSLKEWNNGECKIPIYVGKAVPAGARKGGLGMDVDPGMALYNRLSQHYASVSAAKNLNEHDFKCRYLVVDDIWIPLAESLMIEKYKPLWNHCIEGFGNHDPGAGRSNQQCSPWDCLHEGREWANKLKPCSTSQDELTKRVLAYFEGMKKLQKEENI